MVKYPTHVEGRLLDHFWTNFPEEGVELHQEATYFSDHDVLFILEK